MSNEQKVDQGWETPSHEDIPKITEMHVAALETSNDDAVWVVADMHHVMIRTIGRKSGNEHKIALPYWLDPEGVRIVVASYAGFPTHPSWYINLRDPAANPEVYVRVQNGEFWSAPDILAEGPEHDRLWDLLVADRAWYADYQAKTERTIPLVRLPETRSA